MDKQITNTDEMTVDEVLLKLSETLESNRSLFAKTDLVFAKLLFAYDEEVPAALAKNYLRLAEELIVRRATSTEFIDALDKGGTEQPQTALHYMDAQQELSSNWRAFHKRLSDQGIEEFTDTRGLTADEINEKLISVKGLLDWESTTGSARKWWETFEQENQSRTHIVLRLAEELRNRKATVTEFFLAYVYSNVDNIQANLHYLDYTRLRKEEEKKKRERQAQQKIEVASPTSDLARFFEQKKTTDNEKSGVQTTLEPTVLHGPPTGSDPTSNSSTSKEEPLDLDSSTLPKRIVSALRRSGITSVQELLSKSREELGEIPGVGAVALDTIGKLQKKMRKSRSS